MSLLNIVISGLNQPVDVYCERTGSAFWADPNSKSFWIASGLLACAFISRMIDMILCPYFPIGTHFLRHILNGIMMYVVVKALISPFPFNCSAIKFAHFFVLPLGDI